MKTHTTPTKPKDATTIMMIGAVVLALSAVATIATTLIVFGHSAGAPAVMPPTAVKYEYKCPWIAQNADGTSHQPMANPSKDDLDHDGVDDLCDVCPWVKRDPEQTDRDGDGVGDVCGDNCLIVRNPDQADRDHDSRGDACDNCPAVWNPDQVDSNRDGIGDACQSPSPAPSPSS